MSKARITYLDGRYPYPAAGAHTPGDIVLRPCGTYAIFDGLESCASGERISPQPLNPSQIAIFQKSSASDNIAAGTVVYLIPSTRLITATSTDNVRLGRLTQAAGTGVTHASVNLGA
jgi:hypothetical protein